MEIAIEVLWEKQVKHRRPEQNLKDKAIRKEIYNKIKLTIPPFQKQ